MPTFDEEEIRQEIQQRVNAFVINKDWLTPSGRQRAFPMYEASISNAYLGTTRVIKGGSEAEVTQKAQEQLRKWEEQELRKRVATSKAEAAADATSMTREAQAEISAIRDILGSALKLNSRFDWDSAIDRREFPAFTFNKPAPPRPSDPPPPEPPKKSKLEFVIPSLKRKRLAQISELHKDWDTAKRRLHEKWQASVKAWEAERAAAKEEHERNQHTFREAQDRYNQYFLDFRTRFESGDPEAVEQYLAMVFKRTRYPQGFSPSYAVHFDPRTGTGVVDVSLPPVSEVPRTVEYKYVQKSDELHPVDMKPKEHEELYDRAVKQTVLRTIHEVFESTYTTHVQAVVVNGWVTFVDPASGKDVTSCIISVSTDRAPFEAINLGRIDETACIKSLKGLVAGPLSQLGPVKPILQFDRNDARFIESREVLADMNATTNLAEIPWEDFEHLIRELFGKMFSEEGAEVRVTQASRDGGVDAVAFDPDPIRGGKFVIQAKRYNNVVPVSAVRDLYGTMINEGASKGILVTTSYYGRDSREFAKDKPLTLIDGPNLVYLLDQQGYKVRIELNADHTQNPPHD